MDLLDINFAKNFAYWNITSQKLLFLQKFDFSWFLPNIFVFLALFLPFLTTNNQKLKNPPQNINISLFKHKHNQ